MCASCSKHDGTVSQVLRCWCCAPAQAALAAAVAQYGPLSICINSGDKQPGDWEKYKGPYYE